MYRVIFFIIVCGVLVAGCGRNEASLKCEAYMRAEVSRLAELCDRQRERIRELQNQTDELRAARATDVGHLIKQRDAAERDRDAVNAWLAAQPKPPDRWGGSFVWLYRPSLMDELSGLQAAAWQSPTLRYNVTTVGWVELARVNVDHIDNGASPPKDVMEFVRAAKREMLPILVLRNHRGEYSTLRIPHKGEEELLDLLRGRRESAEWFDKRRITEANHVPKPAAATEAITTEDNS